MAELREEQHAGNAPLRGLVVERLRSMSIARLGRVFVGAGIETCLQAFIALAGAGLLTPAHACPTWNARDRSRLGACKA